MEGGKGARGGRGGTDVVQRVAEADEGPHEDDDRGRKGQFLEVVAMLALGAI